jgi:ATP-dependent DNA helicase RecG
MQTHAITLDTPLSLLSRISPLHQKGLEKIGLHTVRDLLFHFPLRYADMRSTTGAGTLYKGQSVTIYGVMEKVDVKRSFKGHIPMTTAYISDNTGHIRSVWFNQAYIGKIYPEGTKVRVSAIVQEDSKGLFLSNPHIEAVSLIPENTESLFGSTKNEDIQFLTPIYPETKGISSLYLYTLIKKALLHRVLEEIEDPLPKELLEKLHLPLLREALLYIHFPKSESLTVAARKRFAFEEIFYMQIKNQCEKMEAKNLLAYPITLRDKELTMFIDSFPFTPTTAQMDAIKSILKDMKKNQPMGRLLEGDVGSGKTFVAASVAYAVLHTTHSSQQTLQVAYMAPTEILAKQHFESFISYFKDTGIEIGLLTGSGCKKYPSKLTDEPTDISRAQLITWLANGRVSIVIGTHALIQKSVDFAHLALVIIDEQHRFGVKQRQELTQKNRLKKNDPLSPSSALPVSSQTSTKKIPHLLSMTATPIPRTLALTMFGDLDLTVIDSMPKNRKPIITEIVKPSNRTATYDHIRKELQSGRQVYVICPRIDEQDEEERQKRILKSVKEEAKRLSEEIFPEFIVDILHSKMKKNEKEEVMQDFLDKKSDILVATSVVEVGVNVPNATCIIIEHADRFGLAQLHQLRGRVGRAEHQSYCYLFTEGTSDTTYTRLKALVTAKNGFELAEKDMMTRGIGALMDGKQWGVSDLAMEAIKNPKLVEIAQQEAQHLVEHDSTLSKHPLLLSIIKKRRDVHME